MKVVQATTLALSIVALTTIVGGCASKTGPMATDGSGPMSLQQKQLAVENSNMSPEAKQAEEQAAARAAVAPPPVPKKH